MFEFIGAFLSRLWRIANIWRIPPYENASAGIRIGSSSAAVLMFLVMLFALVGLILVIIGALFGVSPFDVLAGIDRWLDSWAPSLDVIGKVLIQKVLMAIILGVCVLIAVLFVFFRKGEDVPGWGKTMLIVLACLMVGYCSTVNMMAPLDPYDPTVGSASVE